jgi:hypothetical protein
MRNDGPIFFMEVLNNEQLDVEAAHSNDGILFIQ